MRKLLWFSGPFALATLVGVCLIPEKLPFLGVGVSVFLLLYSFSFTGKLRLRLLLAALGLTAGFLWCIGYQALFVRPAEQMFGDEVAFTGMVVDEPTETAYGVSVTVRVLPEGSMSYLAKVYLDADYAELPLGSLISATGKISSSDIVRNETVYYHKANSIYAIISRTKNISVTEAEKTPLSLLPAKCAQAIRAKAEQLFSGDVLGLVNALLTGEKDRLSDSFYQALQRSGTAHIVSVSGLHVMLFAQLLLMIPGSQRWKRIAALPVLIGFALITGCRPAIVRAVLMEALMLLGPIFRRDYDPPTALSGALLLLLVQNPFAITSVGLQLSFTSVAGIQLVSGRMTRRFEMFLEPIKGKTWLCKCLWHCFNIFSTSCGALLFSTPLCAFYFGSVSLVGIVTNLLILPFLGTLFALCLLCVGVSFFWIPAASLLAVPCKILALYTVSVCRAMGGLNFAALSMEAPEFVFWLCLFYAVLAAWLCLKWLRKRPAIPAGVMALSLMGVILLHIWRVTAASVNVIALNVGQGQCVTAISGTETIAIDCGGNADNAGDILSDFLQNLNRNELDALILTHFDSDHVNGLEELLERIRVETLYVPEFDSSNRETILSLADDAGCKVVSLSEDAALPFGAGTVEIYAPIEQTEAENNGLSILISYQTEDFLITGDLGLEAEEALIEREQLSDVEYMMAGHHGSKYATGDALLDALTPETVIISVGYNTYGHPTEEVLDRLAVHDCTVYRTDLDGSVLIKLKGA